MEELNIRELREIAEKANAVWETDYLVGGPVDTFYDTFKASVVLALLSSAAAREEAQARVADWTERLQAICEQASCPPGLNRFDFIANRLAALQSAEARAREAEARVEEALKFIDDYFAPWGSWKTAWWEDQVSDDAAFCGDNALKAVANKLRAPFITHDERA